MKNILIMMLPLTMGCEGYITSVDTRRNALKYARNYVGVSYPRGTQFRTFDVQTN
jgi:hypothetical protein